MKRPDLDGLERLLAAVYTARELSQYSAYDQRQQAGSEFWYACLREVPGWLAYTRHLEGLLAAVARAPVDDCGHSVLGELRERVWEVGKESGG